MNRLGVWHAFMLATAAFALAWPASRASETRSARVPSTPEDAGAGQRRSDPDAAWPASALGTSDPRERYRIVEDCMSFRRFDRLFKAEAFNSEYPLNNPDALARLPAAEQRLLADRVALVAAKRADCAAWAEAVDDTSAGALAYHAALDAAAAGDVRAGTCYAVALWPRPDPMFLFPPQTPEATIQDAAGFVHAYRTHAPRLLAEAIAAGYWPAVMAANNIARAEHGLQATVSYNQREAYVFNRLLQRGIDDPEFAQAYQAEAERMAAALTAGERAEADAEAAKRFAGAFGGRPMTEAERYENCGS